MKYFGNQVIFGTMTIGLSSEQYNLPESALNNQPGYTIIDVSGDGTLKFGDISYYINLQNVPGASDIIQNINNLMQILNNIAQNNINSFQTLIDVKSNISGNPGEFIMMDENSNNPNVQTKVVPSGITKTFLNNKLTELTNEINMLKTLSTNGRQGRLQLNTTNKIYTIYHNNINPDTDFPVVSLEIPNSGSLIFIQGIFDRKVNSFKVELSDFPPNNNYYILWNINSSSSIYENYQIDFITSNNYFISSYAYLVIIPNTVTRHYDIYLPRAPIKGKEFRILNYSLHNMYIKTPNNKKINYHNLEKYILYPGKYISCIWSDINELGWIIF